MQEDGALHGDTDASTAFLQASAADHALDGHGNVVQAGVRAVTVAAAQTMLGRTN